MHLACGLALSAGVATVAYAATPTPTGIVVRDAAAPSPAGVDAAKSERSRLHLPAETLLSETFEGNFPADNSWSLRAATAVPYTWNDEDYIAQTGAWSGWCAGGRATTSVPDLDPLFDEYPNDLNAWMIWGPFDLSTASSANLEFSYLNESEIDHDYFRWMASRNGTDFSGFQVSGPAGDWQLAQFRLDNVPTLGSLLGQPQVWIAFQFSSDAATTNIGAFVDDVLLTVERGSPPTVAHTPVASAMQGMPIAIAATVTDDMPSPSAKVHYRAGGDATFLEAALTGAGTMFTGAIPGPAVGTRGVEYYVSASDGQTTAFSPAGGANAPIRVQVAIAGAASPTPQPGGGAQTGFRLISVPYAASPNTVDALLADDLGAYDDKRWRLFRYETGQYFEFPDSRAASLALGKAYWLVLRDRRTIDAGAGQSTSSADSFVVTLEPGWNDVGVPFDFAVQWSDVRVARSRIDGPYAYEGTWLPPANVPTLQPWQGYAIRNTGTSALTLAFPARAAPVPAAAVAAAPAAGAVNDTWTARFETRCEAASDVWNLLGWAVGATSGDDAIDVSEPPPIGEFVSLSFPSALRGRSTNDLRARPSAGDVWRFEVETNIASGAPLVLTWEGFETLPVEFEAALFDPESGARLDPRTAASHVVHDVRRELVLAVGPAAFVEAQARVALVPRRPGLAQNAPNPFNPGTEIRYATSATGRVTLRVFDAGGRHVRTLIDAIQDAGLHRAIWDGRDAHGRMVPSGTYFYRVVSPGYEASRKAIVLR